LLKLDRKIASRIIEKLEYFVRMPDPLFYAKKIKDQTLGQYRFRIGDYRVLFDPVCAGD
jgi:mRNA-degrading endonuclease RelE of RelBE toxin-antitoxin system